MKSHPERHIYGCPDHARTLTASEAAFLTGAGVSEGAFTAPARRVNDAHAAASDTFFDAIARTHLTANETGRILEVSVETVYQRFVDGQLAGGERDGCVVFPRWQLADHGTIPGLPQILRTLPDPDDPMATRAFMLTATDDVLDGLPPKQWLGHVGAVAPVTALMISLRHS